MLTVSQNTERGCCGLLTALVTGWAPPPSPWKALAAPPPPPAPLETSWKGTYLFYEFGCCVSEYHGDGCHRNERTDFYWLASSFQGPSPNPPPSPQSSSRTHPPHTQVPGQCTQQRGRQGPAIGADEIRKISLPPSLPSSRPLPTAIVFKPNNYSNSNNNHHLLALFF